ncbi:hypothetical protein M3643_14400, partial [Staphylococcus lugdunensis]|nr:hypothetical protein [Staphylococcus lugdunensis]
MQDDLRHGAVVTSLDAYRLSIFGTHMYMLYMPNRHHTRATSTFIEFILEQAGKTGRGGPGGMRQGFLSDDKPPGARRQERAGAGSAVAPAPTSTPPSPSNSLLPRVQCSTGFVRIRVPGRCSPPSRSSRSTPA